MPGQGSFGDIETKGKGRKNGTIYSGLDSIGVGEVGESTLLAEEMEGWKKQTRSSRGWPEPSGPRNRF
jgi:hypothetical protein